MRIGVLGGSFNPPHIGHLLIASDAFEALSLDRLLIVPAHANPFKGFDDVAPTAEQRLEMVQRAFSGDQRFEVSSMEIDRGGLSYMVETLETLAAQAPGAELILLLGMDTFQSLDRWLRPGRIRELATIAVFARGDSGATLPDGVIAVTTRRIDVSSSEIRARIEAGRSIKGFVAESVESFVAAAKLYASPAAV